MSPEQVDELLESYRTMSAAALSAAKTRLSEVKLAAVSAGDEALAKWCWTREESLASHELFRLAFQQIKDANNYEGWCTLEKAEICLKSLRRHLADTDWQRFGVGFLEQHIEHWQSLYPYKIFASPEIVFYEARCSICNSLIQIRSGCSHIKGEIYRGELCHHVVTKPELIGISMVKKPVQKYSVAFAHDPATGRHRDHYNYKVVQYVAQRLRSPYDAWTPRPTKARHPHERYRHVGRNDPCPCESGEKYKKCCLRQPGVLRPHVEIDFGVLPDQHLLTTEFTD